MPRRKATSGGKTLRTRGRFSTEPRCCFSANPRCKTGQVSQRMQTQVGMPDDSRVTARGRRATTTKEETCPGGGRRALPETTLVGSGESVKVAVTRSGGPALSATIPAAAGLAVSFTIHAAAHPVPPQAPRHQRFRSPERSVRWTWARWAWARWAWARWAWARWAWSRWGLDRARVGSGCRMDREAQRERGCRMDCDAHWGLGCRMDRGR